MNPTTLAIVNFVFGKFLSAAGGEAGSEIGDAILQMILGTSSDISSQIQTQIGQLQKAVNTLPAQTSTEEQYLTAHTNLHLAITDADLILNFTDSKQVDPTQLAAISTAQWTAIINFVTPGAGTDVNDYASLSSALLYTVYNIQLSDIIDAVTYNPSAATTYYAYEMNLPLLQANPLYLGNYVNAHVQLLMSVLADIAALANAAAAAFQAVQTIYNDRNNHGSIYSTLLTSQQSDISTLMKTSAVKDLTIINTNSGTPFYSTVSDYVQNAPLYLCSNAYNDFANIVTGKQVSIMNTDIASGMYMYNDSVTGSASPSDPCFVVFLMPASPPLTLWNIAFTDSSQNTVTISNVGGLMTGGLLYNYGMRGYVTPSKTELGSVPNEYFSPTVSDCNWYLQLWGDGEPYDLTFTYRIVNNGGSLINGEALIPSAMNVPNMFNIGSGSGQSLFKLEW
jgi:hypothetical protein